MVFVLDRRKKPLMPCSERRARILLQRGRAVVHRLRPFTIRLRDRTAGESVLQPLRLKVAPATKVTGGALVRDDGPDAGAVVFAAEIKHKPGIHAKMLRRAGYRRRRRSANLRYRAPRFDNRRPEPCIVCGGNARHGHNRCRRCVEAGDEPAGLGARPPRLAPTLRSRADNTRSWVARLRRWAPVTAASVLLGRYDTQALQDPEVRGVEYQQGTLQGYEVREYLLEKFGHRCVYCGGLSGDPVLNIDHVVPRSREGTDRVSNLALACRACNEAKDDRPPEEWAARLARLHSPLAVARMAGCKAVAGRLQAPLRGPAAVNATRWAVWRVLAQTGLPLEAGTAARTKWNRARLGEPRSPAADAACVGASTPAALRWAGRWVHAITALGRGRYQRTNTDAHGFPRGYLMRGKSVHGLRSGDLVTAGVRHRAGGRLPAAFVAEIEATGPVAVRASGSFRLGPFDPVRWQASRLLQRGDGYAYHVAPLGDTGARRGGGVELEEAAP